VTRRSGIGKKGMPVSWMETEVSTVTWRGAMWPYMDKKSRNEFSGLARMLLYRKNPVRMLHGEGGNWK
jgi:hypothetical protein